MKNEVFEVFDYILSSDTPELLFLKNTLKDRLKKCDKNEYGILLEARTT